MREQWVTFSTQDGKEKVTYTVKGTFAGEMKATRDQVAAENGCRPEEIKIEIKPKAKKGA